MSFSPLWTELRPSYEEECQEEEGGCKQMVLLSGSQWRLNQGRAQGNPPQSAQIPACSMPGAAKEQEGRIPGLHPGSCLVHPHSPPAPRASTLQAEQAPALEYFKAFFFLQEERIEVK